MTVSNSRRVLISGDGTAKGTKITDAVSGEQIGLVQGYTIKHRVNEAARAVIEVLLPKVDLECDANVIGVAYGAQDTEVAPTYAPHEMRVMQEKTELDAKRLALRDFMEDRSKFYKLDAVDQELLINQLAAMNGYSSCLGQRIARFKPQQHPAIAAMQPLESDGKGLDLNDDTPLAPACDLTGDGTCEACQ